MTGELEQKNAQPCVLAQDAQHILLHGEKWVRQSTDSPVDIAIGFLENNRELQQLPSPSQVINGAWARAGRVLMTTILTVLFARWCGWIEIAFLIGLLGAGWLGTMAWMTVRCLLSGNLAIRTLLAGGISIPAAVMAAGYTGLSIDAKAGQDVAWLGLLKFGQTDYVVFLTGATLFIVVIVIVAILQIKSRPAISELR